MDTKKLIPRWLTAAVAVLCALTTVCSIVMLFSGGHAFIHIAAILACVPALLYCFRGCDKRSSVLFKLFLVCCTLLHLADLYCGFAALFTGGYLSVISTAGDVMGTVLFIIMITTDDIGRTKSYILTLLIVAAGLLTLAGHMLIGEYTVLSVLSTLSLLFICAATVWAKYKDKDSRGTI